MTDDLTILEDADERGLHRNSDIPLDGSSIDARAKAGSRAVRDAAVLMPLIRDQGVWHILFIRRAANPRDRHSGQVAFPGGAADVEDDDLSMTALRETHEEIGVARNHIRLIGRIDAYTTISNYRVTPFVGELDWPVKLTLQSSEVARAFLMPLAFLSERDNFTLRARNEMDSQTARRHPIIVYEEYDGERLWGATARMTLNLVKAIDDGKIVLPRLSTDH